MLSLRPGRTSRKVLIPTLVLSTALSACGGGNEGAETVESAADDGLVESVKIDVKACELLKNEEIAEQLFLSVSPEERSSWKSREFDVSATAPDYGGNPRCEYQFASRYAVGGGPVWHSDFDLTVFPANAIALSEGDRTPIEGAGPDVFKERGTQPAYYVVKGDLAVTLSRFPGRDENEAGGIDGGRLVLLRLIAERLP
jgi:hypothetical protein